MTFNKNGNITKASFTADIKRKQALYNRFKRRYHATNNPSERKWIKNEATRLVTELRQWCKKWQTWGFGGYNWIVKDYNVSSFNNYKGYKSYKSYSKPVAARTTSNRPSARKSSTTRTYARKNTRTTVRNTNSTRSNARRTSRTRSNAARKSYSAW